MTNAETTTTVAERAPRRAGEASSKKATSPKKSAPKAKKTAKAAKPKKDRAQESDQTRSRAQQQEGRSHRDDETREGRDAGRDYGRHRLAKAHSPGLRQHSGQQGRRDDRVLEERRRGEDVQNREVAAPFPTTPLLATSLGRRFCLWSRNARARNVLAPSRTNSQRRATGAQRGVVGLPWRTIGAPRCLARLGDNSE